MLNLKNGIMATYEKGILGPFSGKVGTVVGANWRGKNIMRSRPKKSNRPPTEAQQLQRERFTAVSRFLNPIKGLLNRYFGQKMGFRSRYNMATSYHIKEATEWVNEEWEIIFNKVMISKGVLQGLHNPTVDPQLNNQLKLEWSDNSGQGMAKGDDRLLMIAYCPNLDLYEVFENSALREDREVVLSFNSHFQGLEVHCWASFVNSEQKVSASSSYLGEFELR
ncbi:MAG: DUF6266 family protein [Flavobacteriaceae bacterium]|jgi:hypothetical protein|nr:DUF6266 family protein [Flavobacteriaceae bacterium]